MSIIHPHRGTTLVEFALILPVFVLILGSILEFGWFFYEHTMLVQAVRAGCLQGAKTHPDSAPDTVAEAAISANLQDSHFRCPTSGCQPDVQQAGTSPMEILTCSVIIPYEPIVAMVPGMDDVDMSATTTVRLELQP